MKKLLNTKITTITIAEAIIERAVFAGILSGTVNTVLAAASALHLNIPYGNGFNSIDALVMLALSYGLYCRSRLCAIGLFAFFLIGKIWILIEYKQFPNGVALVFLYLFFEGIRATFAYHRLQKGVPKLILN